MMSSFRSVIALVASLTLLAAACGSDDGDDAGVAGSGKTDRPTVVVTTNILGDVVEQMVGDHADVVTVMPVGADPHDFQASARQVAQIGDAAVLISNGAAFEEGLVDVIEAAEADGTVVHEAITAVSTIEFGKGGHGHDDDEDLDDEDHDDDDHDDDGHDDDHDGDDPHFFTDPARMAVAAAGILDFLVANLDGVDADAVRASGDAYITELEALDAEVEETLSSLSKEQRVLVTNHEVFGYFAERYGFEVVGTVVPSDSTADGASAQALAELAEIVEDEGVPAIFTDTSSSDELAQTLADEVGDIEVVELFTESLGEADSDGATYLDMVRANAARIADALAG